jgi:TP901 family phage tail tape measure protein
MSIALNNLNFMISLTDRISGPLGKVMKSIDQASVGFKSGAQKIGYGLAGITGAAYSINSLLEPTKEMQRALGEVKSLGVADDTLNKLRITALKFGTQYGESAAGFVKASYDIQSAIAGLSGDELSRFTEVSGVLAKGTKANVADITNYVGTMYGIFQKSADAMGKAQWIEKMAAQTAMAVNIFKSDGRNMAASFTAIGAAAQNFGVSMAEQFAVLGKLQATMSGAEAGTKYRSFLDNVGKAQQKLNLKFVDAQGRMLPIVEILGKIQQKFGDIDKVAEADLLKKAFGTDEAVALIKLLNNDLTGLQQNIADIGQQNGMDSINKMADAMTDPWARMKSGVDAISVSIGTKLLPVMLPVIAGVSDATQSILAWTDANPRLAKAIGVVTLGVFGSIGTLALFSIAAGYATIVTSGWRLAVDNVFKPLKDMAVAIWTNLPAIWAWTKSLFTTPITLANLQSGLAAATAKLWAFTTAIFANPMTWWILGIAAVAGIVVAAIVYWKEWTAVVSQFGTIAGQLWNSILIGLDATKSLVIDATSRFLELIGVFALVDKVPVIWERLKQWLTGFKAWIGTLDPFALIGDGIGSVMARLEALPVWFSGFKAQLGVLNPFALAGDGLSLVMTGLEALPLWWSGFKAQLGVLNPFALVGDGIGSVMARLEALPVWFSGFKAQLGVLDPFAALTAGIGLLVAGFDAVPQWWNNFTAWIGTLDPWALLGDGIGLLVAGFEAVRNWWSGFKSWLAGLNPFGAILNGLNQVIGLANKIPGINIDPIKSVAAPLATAPQASPHNGGIIKKMSSVMNANKSTSIGDVNVHNYGQPISGARIRDELLMAAG